MYKYVANGHWDLKTDEVNWWMLNQSERHLCVTETPRTFRLNIEYEMRGVYRGTPTQ